MRFLQWLLPSMAYLSIYVLQEFMRDSESAGGDEN